MIKQTKLKVIIILIITAIIIIGGTSFSTIIVSGQNQNTQDIERRLKDKGIPVLSVQTRSRMPFNIEIILQSESEGNKLSVDDNWSMIVANREAKLASRIGIRLDSYRLTMVNSFGSRILSEDHFLYPDDDMPTQNSTSQSIVIDQEIIDFVRDRIDYGDFYVDMLDVIPEDHAGGAERTLLIQLSEPKSDVARQSLQPFVTSLLMMLYDEDRIKGTNIVLCHARVLNSEGRVIFDLVYDLEARRLQTSNRSGLHVDGPWSSIPTATSEGQKPPEKMVSPTPDPKIQSYPPPAATPTSAPYP